MKKICLFTLFCSALLLTSCGDFDSSFYSVPTDISSDITTTTTVAQEHIIDTTSTAISYTFSHGDEHDTAPFIESEPDATDTPVSELTADISVTSEPLPKETDIASSVTTTIPTTTTSKNNTTTTTQPPVSFNPENKKVYVSGYTVFYVSASDSSSAYCYISPGSEISVTALSSDGKWYCAVYNGIKGYVKTAQTTTNKPVTSATTTKAPPKTTTTTTKATTKVATTTKANATTAGTMYALDPTFEKQRIAAENDIVKYTNQLRASLGEGTLTVDSRLSHAAMIRAQEISILFDHLRLDGRKSLTVFNDVGCGYFHSMGENIASATGFMQTGEGFFGQWKNSDGHYKNMTNSKYNKIGVAVYYVYKNGKYYCYSVQLFGRE